MAVIYEDYEAAAITLLIRLVLKGLWLQILKTAQVS